jgi:hypothetical protein
MRPTRLDRRKVLGLGIASMVLPHAGAGQPDRSEGYVNGDGVRLFLVRAGDGPSCCFHAARRRSL